MDQFYLIVLGIAVVILIIALTYIGLKMKYNKISSGFPPKANSCPDYWIVDPSGCIPPSDLVNNPNKGNYNYNATCSNALKCMNFADTSKFNSICSKKKFVNQNQIVWDGVSNYNSC